MKNVILLGSTGMIGNLILQKCLQRQDVAKITSITRSKINGKHSKLSEIIHPDFLNLM
jgi:saccharopine dehydrogenase-like NADP-dependent oxidoreductase